MLFFYQNSRILIKAVVMIYLNKVNRCQPKDLSYLFVVNYIITISVILRSTFTIQQYLVRCSIGNMLLSIFSSKLMSLLIDIRVPKAGTKHGISNWKSTALTTTLRRRPCINDIYITHIFVHKTCKFSKFINHLTTFYLRQLQAFAFIYINVIILIYLINAICYFHIALI